MELTVANVYGLLLRSKLLAPEEARLMLGRWQSEAGDMAGNVGRFAVWMVTNRYLTEYQAGLLARGHADGFFLDTYKILDRIGKGHMAGVYKAMHQLGQVVAIKVLPPSKARQPETLQRFHREAHLAMKLQHPNIVRVFQLGLAKQESGEPLHYIVMDFLDGESLDEILTRRGKLPPAEAVRLVHQALQGLQHIHSQGLIHRDLKPSNLMVVNTNQPPGTIPADTLNSTLKIVDMGLGRSLFSSTNMDRGIEEGLSREGTILGTPDYMSPEQARDSTTIDGRSDIYSLGCVLYQLLAGQVPFPDTNVIRLMLRHSTETPRPLVELNPEVPDGLQKIVSWMMAKDRNKRYDKPERAAQALEVFLAAGPGDDRPTAESEGKLKKYLTWLQVNQDSNNLANQAPVPAVVATPVPAGANAPSDTSVVVPKKSNPKVRPAQPTLTSTPSAGPGGAANPKPTPPLLPQTAPEPPRKQQLPVGDRKARRLAKKPLGLPETPKAQNTSPNLTPEPENSINVELISLPSLELPARSFFDLRKFDRRDLFLFGLGVVAGGLAVGAGCFLALRRATKPPPESE